MTRPPQRSESIVDDLYAGTMDPSRWERAMLRIVKSLGSSGAALFAFNPARGIVLRDEGYGFEGLEEKSARHRQWLESSPDPRFRPSLQQPVLKPMVEELFMPMKEWRRSAIYNELMRPIDCAYCLCTWLHKGAHRMVALSIQASTRRGPFDAADQRLLQPLLPHISRALEIKDRLELRELRGDTLAAGLNRAPFGLIVLNARGKLIEANATAEHVLRSEPAIFRDRDGLLRLQGNADSELRKWVLAGRPPDNNRDGLIHVQRHPRQPLSILVAPLPEAVPSWTGTNPRWILLLFDPERASELSLPLIAADLGISDREAQVAALLATGMDLQRAALRMGISRETARTHLKSIFSKTGLHSQAELVRRVMRSPAVLNHQG